MFFLYNKWSGPFKMDSIWSTLTESAKLENDIDTSEQRKPRWRTWFVCEASGSWIEKITKEVKV